MSFGLGFQFTTGLQLGFRGLGYDYDYRLKPKVKGVMIYGYTVIVAITK